MIQSVDHVIGNGSTHSYISAGWIDLQVNGFAGVDYNTPSTPHEEIARSIRILHSTGITRFLPTVITGAPDDMAGALGNLARARESLEEGPAMEGFHVEGPHISPEDGPRGAHPKVWVRKPDLDEFRRWQDAAQGNVRLVTLSPEWPEAVRYIEALVREGVVVSIGHTKAGPREIADAISAGATLSTHIGNGAHAVMQRHPNYIWEQLAEDRLTAGFIADGIHLGAAFLKVGLRAKGVERAFIVTDAVMPAGCAPGRYKLGEVEVELHPGDRVTLAGNNRLAGSALRMERGIENLMKLAGLSLTEAITMATRNPARAARIAGRQRGLAPGERGDIVQFRFDPDSKHIEVERTWVSGKEMYKAA
ncbi:MAG: amidohydrolase family protein [Bryobacterales bacterium]|nr:amidohydrolase family protein [Bryobacterales bacterium]MEB2361928.1 amidohydrolase family protein [Bryobacterales bacterium]